jgi:hypothetical protein
VVAQHTLWPAADDTAAAARAASGTFKQTSHTWCCAAASISSALHKTIAAGARVSVLGATTSTTRSRLMHCAQQATATLTRVHASDGRCTVSAAAAARSLHCATGVHCCATPSANDPDPARKCEGWQRLHALTHDELHHASIKIPSNIN